MGVKMAYPTFRGKRAAPGKRPRARKSPAIDARRVNAPPAIFVRLEGKPWYRSTYARAHLRNRKGYVYLSWRDCERVRELYLGKAPRKSPTLELELERLAPAAGEVLHEIPRRGKTRV